MTNKTITAIFDKYSDASAAVRTLETAGISHDHISIVSNDSAHMQYHGSYDHTGTGTGTGVSLGSLLGGSAGLLAGLGLLAIPGLGPVVAAGWLASTLLGAGVGAATGGVVGALTDAGINETDAHAYAEGVRRGGTLVTVRADDVTSKKVADILGAHGTVNMDDREANWRKEGWTGTHQAPSVTESLGAAAGTAAHAVGHVARDVKNTLKEELTPTARGVGDRPAGSQGASETIPVIEEKLRVGKREENLGHVRIHSTVVATPVQEQVTLHSEKVTIDRHPVDRPLSGSDDAHFRDRTIEATEHREVPLVAKEARVKEEIALQKSATTRVETVSDTVRHTEVEVTDERGHVIKPGSAATTPPRTPK